MLVPFLQNAHAPVSYVNGSPRPSETTIPAFTFSILALATLLFGLVPLRIVLSAGPALALKTSAAASRTDAGKSRASRTLLLCR